MARKVRLMQGRTEARRAQTWRQTCTLLLAGAAVLLPLRHAQAAMNFCAAPALQTSERTNADPGVKALVSNVQAHLNDPPRALASATSAPARRARSTTSAANLRSSRDWSCSMLFPRSSECRRRAQALRLIRCSARNVQ